MELGLPPLPRLGYSGCFYSLFNALSDEPDMQMAMIDGTIVKVHRPLSAIEGNRLPGNGQGSKGGLKVRRQASRRAVGRPGFLR